MIGVLIILTNERGDFEKSVYFFLRDAYEGYTLNKYDAETVDRLQSSVSICSKYMFTIK